MNCDLNDSVFNHIITNVDGITKLSLEETTDGKVISLK